MRSSLPYPSRGVFGFLAWTPERWVGMTTFLIPKAVNGWFVMSSSLITGFFTSASLILAIGAQNAFVLRQGLRREHVLLVCLLCACSDALLIAAGVFGLGALVQAAPMFVNFMRIAGALFLAIYGLQSFRSAWRGGQSLEAGEANAPSNRRDVALTCLALTWLNPHVYLDTLLLLGGIAAQDPAPQLFGLGAICASFAFFFSLGYGARLLAPLFAKPSAWRVLDVLVGALMWVIAIVLLLSVEL